MGFRVKYMSNFVIRAGTLKIHPKIVLINKVLSIFCFSTLGKSVIVKSVENKYSAKEKENQ